MGLDSKSLYNFILQTCGSALHHSPSQHLTQYLVWPAQGCYLTNTTSFNQSSSKCTACIYCSCDAPSMLSLSRDGAMKHSTYVSDHMHSKAWSANICCSNDYQAEQNGFACIYDRLRIAARLLSAEPIMRERQVHECRMLANKQRLMSAAAWVLPFIRSVSFSSTLM